MHCAWPTVNRSSTLPMLSPHLHLSVPHSVQFLAQGNARLIWVRKQRNHAHMYVYLSGHNITHYSVAWCPSSQNDVIGMTPRHNPIFFAFKEYTHAIMFHLFQMQFLEIWDCFSLLKGILLNKAQSLCSLIAISKAALPRQHHQSMRECVSGGLLFFFWGSVMFVFQQKLSSK